MTDRIVMLDGSLLIVLVREKTSGRVQRTVSVKHYLIIHTLQDEVK